MIRVTLAGLLAKKVRLVLTSIAVVMGVAFMAGTFVLTDTLGHVFDDLFANTTKGVDAVVRAREPFKASDQPGGNNTQTRPPVPAALEAEIRQVPQVAAVQGSLLGYSLVIDKHGDAIQNQAPSLGTQWSSGPRAVNRSLTLLRGAPPRAPDQVALDKQTFEDGGFRLGDRVKIVFLQVPPREFRLTGEFLFGGKQSGLAGATLAAFTPATAQAVMGRPGAWDRIDVRAKPGVSEVEVRDAIRRELRAEGQSKQYEAITGEKLAEEQANQIKGNLSFFNTFLLVFALVALFVGAFIIYNTFSITVAQRTRELGLLRALGASGRQVVASVAFEAVVVGLISSVLGLGLGLAIVKPLETLLSAFGIDLPSGSLQVLPRTVIASLAVGTIVTFVSAIAPARRAARVTPIAAIRAEAIPPSSGRRRYLWGTILTLAGAAGLGYGLFAGGGGNAAITVGAAAALVFVGVAMLSPVLARPAAQVLAWPARRLHRVTGVLAGQNAMRNPRRTASTAAALMIGLALVSLIAIFGASAKDSFAAIIDDQTRADFVLSSKSFQGFTPEAATAVRRRLPGATVVELRSASVRLGGESVSVMGVPGNIERAIDVKLRPGADTRAFDRDGGVFVYKDTARDKHLKFGDRVRTVFPKGTRRLRVDGVFAENKVLSSDYLVSLTNWKLFDQAADGAVLILKPSTTTTAAADRVVKRVAREFPGIKAQNKVQYRDSQLAQFDQILGLMYVLLLFAVIIALIGIVNTLALSVYERTHEIGLLRAVGMSRRQMGRMIRGEALIVAVFGSLLGLVIGVLFGGAIVQALGSEGITLSVPVSQLVIFVILAGLAGLGAGWWPARRAAHLDVLRAISTE